MSKSKWEPFPLPPRKPIQVKWWWYVLVVAALCVTISIIFSACGDDDDATDPGPSSWFTSTSPSGQQVECIVVSGYEEQSVWCLVVEQ